MPRVGWAGLVGGALLLVACTGTPPMTADAPVASGAPATETASTPSGSASPAPTPAPASRSPSPTPSAEPATTTPLVLAVHPARARRDVPAGTARRLVAGEVRDWRELGYAPRHIARIPGDDPAAAVAQVAADPDALAVLPATAVDPRVTTLTVGGVDPLREPARYPLETDGPRAPEPVTITVTGDVMLGRRVADAARAAGDPSAPLRPLQRRLARADVTIGTLESTLSTDGSPTQGGDSFTAPPAVLRGLRDAGFDVLSLANNHVGDWGVRALLQTVDRVRAGGIDPVGAGRDVAEARTPAIIERNGVRIGVLAFNSIGETPRATSSSPGAAVIRMPPRTSPFVPSDLRAMEAAVRNLATRVDAVVVVPHWGTQYTHVPEPEQRRVARALIAAGAEVVAGGHPHWVQGVEFVGGGFVAHSLANFVFDMDFSTQTQQGVLLELVLWDGDVKAYELVPYRIGPQSAEFAPRLASASEGREILADVRSTSRAPFNVAPRR